MELDLTKLLDAGAGVIGVVITGVLTIVGGFVTLVTKAWLDGRKEKQDRELNYPQHATIGIAQWSKVYTRARHLIDTGVFERFLCKMLVKNENSVTILTVFYADYASPSLFDGTSRYDRVSIDTVYESILENAKDEVCWVTLESLPRESQLYRWYIDEGVTEAAMLVVHASEERTYAISCATYRAGGFSQSQRNDIELFLVSAKDLVK